MHTYSDSGSRPNQPVPETGFDPWEFTRTISPRPRVRVAVTDAYGAATNCYTTTTDVNGARPAAPWAVNLADIDQAYRLLCFDFDVSPAFNPAADAATLTAALEAAGASPLVCESSATGGRHVWVRLAEPTPAARVSRWGRRLTLTLPTLDAGMLSNPVTGCVRPPGSPHRDGSTSRVLDGDLAAFMEHPATTAQIENAIATVAPPDPTGRTLGDREPSPDGVTCRGADGQPKIPGRRRPLPPAAVVASRHGRDDTSAALAAVLAGAARARWTLADVTERLTDTPGLEHVRTAATRTSHRRPRSVREQQRVLTRQWARAVAFVATSIATNGDHGTTPEWEHRAAAALEVVDQVQTKADAMCGRWNSGRGPGQRRVLDVLCWWSLQAGRVDVEADIRRIALTTGIGRETARLALHALAADGWIELTTPAAGIHAHTWRIRHPAELSTPHRSTEWSQAAPPPPWWTDDRLWWLTVLGDRIAVVGHPAFSTAGTGLAVGNTAARLNDHTTNDSGHLLTLELHGLTRTAGPRLVLVDEHALDRYATLTGAAAVAEARQVTYQRERTLWAWWQAELGWMRRPRSRTAAPVLGQYTFDGTAIRATRHPRRADGSADWRAARMAA